MKDERTANLRRLAGGTAAMLSLGDFPLFLIVPTEAGWIAGFTQARTLTPAAFAWALQGGED